MSEAVAKKMENLRTMIGLRAREVAELLDTSSQTVSRWTTGKSQPHPNNLERLLQLNWLAERLHGIYPADEARLWLYSRHPLLGGDRPVDRIQNGRLDDILALIDQLQTGAVV